MPGWSVTLRTIVESDAARPPWLDDFLPGWIERLQDRKLLPRDGIGASARIRLLREAMALHRGAEGLAELARSEGAEHGEVYADWVSALADAGDAHGALRAAEEGVARVKEGWARAGLADRLSSLADDAGNAKLALHAAREAWRGRATCRRIIRLCSVGAPTASALEARLRTEIDHEVPKDDRPSASLAALLHLLAGDVDGPVRSLARAKPLGWSGDDNVGPVVTPFLLVAASCPEGPPEGSVLAELWSDVDAIGSWELDDRPFDEDGEDDDSDEDLPVSLTESTITALLLHAIERRPLQARERTRFLDAAVKTCRARADAISAGKHRRAYGRAATAIVAAAEALVLAGRRDEGVALVAQTRETHRRKPAFCADLEDTEARSAIMKKAARG